MSFQKNLPSGIGRREFILLIASMMAISALAIDTMLPAFGAMSADFGLTGESANHIQWVIYAFMTGFSFAQLCYGAMADYWGRKPIVLLGVVIFSLLLGMLASGGERRWVAPQRGMGAIDVFLRATYDLQPRPVATDYLAAATELSQRHRRRSLVMLVTNLRDEDSDDLLGAVRMLQQRHHVVVASLREEALDAVLDEDVRDLRGALRAGAAARYIAQRTAVHDALRSHRVGVLDVTCEQLPGALVERYLAVKRDGVLVEPFEDMRLPVNKAYYLVHHKQAILRPAARALREWLLGVVGREG